MKVYATPLEGALRIELEPFCDDRGLFAEGYVLKKLAAQGLEFDVKRVHLVRNEHAGTVRGMHWQAEPWTQGKIVMAASGSIFDAIVDVRPKSPTYSQSYSLKLFPLANALFIPRGFAHGCQALEDDSTLIYLVDNDYMPSHERGIPPADPTAAIQWPLAPMYIANRDKAWPTLDELSRVGHA